MYHLMPEVEVSCKKCGKVLANKRKLYEHNSFCSKEAIHACHLCDYKHKFKRIVKNHVEVVHMGKVLVCDYCRKEYAYRHNLRLHIQKYHPAEWAAEEAERVKNKKN
jgi:hypothetical protein